MSVVIIGGKLQGTEAAYLAGKAGMESVLIDRNPNVPARDLATRFVQADILRDDIKTETIKELCRAEFVLPAMENAATLHRLKALSEEYGFILAFDPEAYRITSSKIQSDRLMRRHGVPAPRYYSEIPPEESQDMKFIAKPSGGSGSDGVKFFESAAGLHGFLQTKGGDDWVVQEYLEGRQFSIEVAGLPGNYRTYQVTELFMDSAYDCRRVTAPADIPQSVGEELAATAKKLAGILNLRGIMDVEAVYHCGEMKVLEIDARLPSQTPTAVLCSTGMNFILELRDIFVRGEFTERLKTGESQTRYAAYEHVLVEGGGIRSLGEHIMAEAGPLRRVEGFYGADEALTGVRPFPATMINTADSPAELAAKEARMYERIRIGHE